MNSSYTREAAFNGWELPILCTLPAIILLSALGIGVSIVCLSLGESIVFPHLFYLPIIVTAIGYPKRGFIFTSGISAVYILLVIGLTKDMSQFWPALVRVVFFELVTAVIVYLSRKKQKAEKLLILQHEEMETIIKERTEQLRNELGQTLRLAHAYREANERFEQGINALNVAYVRWNAEMYITYTNRTFERILGREKNDLIGRKLSSIPFLEEAWKNYRIDPIRSEIRTGAEAHGLHWVFSDVFENGSTMPESFLGIGMDIGNEGQKR
jgi:PAS domain-containing protein